MLTLRRDPGTVTRLTIILVLIALGAGIVYVSGRPGRLPQSDWYEISRQRILQADLMYRMALYLDLVMPDEPLPAIGGARQLKERAIADYERETLGGRPNPAALHRLGVVYGERGYYEQARQALARAATLDETHAGLFFSLAAVYSPPESFRPLGPQEIKRLRHQEQWLAGIALPDYYARTNDAAAAQQAREWARQQTSAFGLRLLVLLGVYGGLGLTGLTILTTAIVRWAFYVRPKRPVRPSLVVTWEPLDAFEVVALLYFMMVATGVAAGLLIARFLPNAPDWVHVSIVAFQYLLVTAGALLVVWRRVAGRQNRKLSILGLRFRRLGRLITQGIGGYAVLVVVLVLVTILLPGGTSLGWLAQGGERILSATHSPGARVGLFVLICVLAPILEETIFRGFVYPGLRRRMPVTAAVLLSAALFALMHVNPAALVPIGLIGIVLAVLYERNMSLVPSIICHALNNTLVFFLMLLTS